MKYILSLSLATALLFSCHSGGQASSSATDTTSVSMATPAPFDADSAYSYIRQQVEMGVRTPGSAGHRACGDWIVARLKGYGFEVQEQFFPGKTYSGEAIEGRNIIASLNPSNSQRLLLMAHWDTRAVADEDANGARREQAIEGADDGASGVAVLLELARQWQITPPSVGIDIIFFDLEDGGHSGDTDSWCLGSQYWAQNPHTKPYKAEGGILLDMVGARGARFHWELYSKQYAAPLLSELWSLAQGLGHGEYFKQSEGGALIDDHLPVMKYLGIPCVDIINYSESNGREGFGSHWHTHEDKLSIIDKATLNAVGQTVATYVQSLKK